MNSLNEVPLLTISRSLAELPAQTATRVQFEILPLLVWMQMDGSFGMLLNNVLGALFFSINLIKNVLGYRKVKT